MRNKQVTAQQLRDSLGLTQGYMSYLRRKGAPAPTSRGKNARYSLKDWCTWIVDNLDGNTKGNVIKARAIALQTGVKDQVENVVTDEITSDDRKGLEFALDRLREAENVTHQRWLASFNANAPDSPAHFKEWQQALEQLRKSEKSLTEHLKEQKELLPASEIQKHISNMVTAAKTTLLDLPGKVAPALDMQDWPTIQKILMDEVKFAIGKLKAM